MRIVRPVAFPILVLLPLVGLPSEESEGLRVARGLERAFIEVAARVEPGVVAVRGYRKIEGAAAEDVSGWRANEVAAYPGHARRTAGSGFFVDAEGYIVTTRDAVRHPDDDAPVDLVEVEFGRQIRVRGRIVGIEPTVNLAVVKIDTPVPLAALPLADSDALRVGQWALSFGDPPGAEKTFATGVVSLTPQRDCYQEELTRTYLQTSVRVPEGALGGPIVDLDGRVMGISVPGGESRTAGSGFALPSNLVRTLYEALREKESRVSPWIGVSVLHLSPDLRRSMGDSPRTGIYIDNVFDPSPAAAAGVRVGDVLTELGGQRILAVEDFQRWLYLLGVGAEAELVVWRDGKTLRRSVRIEQRPQNAITR